MFLKELGLSKVDIVITWIKLDVNKPRIPRIALLNVYQQKHCDDISSLWNRPNSKSTNTIEMTKLKNLFWILK